MSDSNIFFENQGPFSLSKIIETSESKSYSDRDKKIKINNIIDLFRAKPNDITFLNSAKYKNDSINSKATACITTKDLAKYLPKNGFACGKALILLSFSLISDHLRGSRTLFSHILARSCVKVNITTHTSDMTIKHRLTRFKWFLMLMHISSYFE